MEWWVDLIILVICTIVACVMEQVMPLYDFEYDNKLCKNNIMKILVTFITCVSVFGGLFFSIFLSTALCKEHSVLGDNIFLAILTYVIPLGLAYGTFVLSDYWWKGRDDRISRGRERKERKNIKEGD